jgi:hypothetical protein
MRSFACALSALLVATATPAAAVTLLVGDTPLPGTTVADRPELAGPVIADRLVGYSLEVDGQILSGQVQQSVVRSASDGTLDFTWRIRPDGEGTLPVIALRLAGFGDFITDGDWRSDGLGAVAPAIARKFDTPGFVNFIFDQPVGPGADQSSYFFFLKTSAVRYDESGSYDLLCAHTECVTEAFATFAPSAAVPEPAAWALMILGFGAMGGMLRRRTRAGLVVA